MSILRGLLPLLCLMPLGALAADPLSLPAVSSAANAAGGQEYSVSLQLLAIMTALTLLPALLLGMTAFTRIMIVLSILRQALGTGQTPSNQVLLSLSLFLTLFVMYPIGEQAYTQAVAPYIAEEMTFQEAMTTGFEPFRAFMLSQTREDDIARFAEIAGHAAYQKPEDVPFSVLMASFLTSELKTAFQIGFLVFIPFVVIDLVVASVLMSMGMMMLSPMMISLPFKIMLFVLVDGWGLMMGSLAASFYR
ncbi:MULTISPECIES: flagellar type III secretion system pore protein FliP [Spongiibacter]|uniref:flagellar type III secretion system pore protein FliP n=2 Tax=Spongiibacteraceae TaxID=1706375 RepID=UPI000C5656F0|nr:flagellar biosynthetic protein FliP [Spongiibacter sp.]|tara:strand:- start:528 stop:1274 length:747 start_codon:yes stop_codon:yes gene_type:complete